MAVECLKPYKTSAKQKRDRGRDSQPGPRPRLNSQPQGTTKHLGTRLFWYPFVACLLFSKIMRQENIAASSSIASDTFGNVRTVPHCQLSAPKSRDSLWLRRRFLPLRKNRCDFFLLPQLACQACSISAWFKLRKDYFAGKTTGKFSSCACPKIPGKIAYSSATRSKITGKFSSVKNNCFRCNEAKLLGDSTVLCLSGNLPLRGSLFSEGFQRFSEVFRGS